jgi:alpha-D-ribose 1-methylphosphonate 5-triphosphate diphosphatase PhnM
MGIGKAPGFKLISLKEHQIWENQFHELNTYQIFFMREKNIDLLNRPPNLGVEYSDIFHRV